MELKRTLLFAPVVFLLSCGNPGNQQTNEETETEEANPNQALYDQVMDVHDEVMPKMEDIYKLKSQLQEQIANAPDMVNEKKQSVEKMILKLDSANNAMMDWMHQFNPLPDSVDEEDARAYLEEQMEKIKKVKEEMLMAIEQAKAEQPN